MLVNAISLYRSRYIRITTLLQYVNEIKVSHCLSYFLSPGKAPELLAATAKKRRKRKGKMPKSFDPKVDPDPERWLPRKDRSTYKGRRRDKRKDAAGIGKGTQGGVGNAEGVDYSKPAPGKGDLWVVVGASF